MSRLLDLSEPPRYERQTAGLKLDPYRVSIMAMLDTDARASPEGIIERLRRGGYRGGITILKECLADVSPSFVGVKGFQRTSYLPGETGQTDWWEPPASVPADKGVERPVFDVVTDAA